MAVSTLALAKTGAALLLVIVLVVFGETREQRQPANLEGYVYQTCADDRLVGPVAGAIVSTSVDAMTTRTDANGHFQMHTDSPVFADEFYTVSVRAGDLTVTDRTMLKNGVNNLPRQVSFVLSPPEPIMARFDQSRQRVWCHAYQPPVLAAKTQR
jgi:hypothetical protein